MSLFFKDEPKAAVATPLTASARVVNHAKAAPYMQHRPIIASAQKLPTDKVVQNQAYHEWQRDAWVGYEKIGEIHYGFGLVANNLSKVRIYAAILANSDEAPQEVNEAAQGGSKIVSSDLATKASQVMSELTSVGLPSFLWAYAINMQVPGECYMVHLPDESPMGKDGKPLRDNYGQVVPPKKTWTIRSTDEIKVKPGLIEYVPMRGSTDGRRELPLDTFIGRIWRPSGRYSGEPDSSMAAIAEPIEELLSISRLVRSTTRSRLNAGMLFVPDDIVAVNRTEQAEKLDAEGKPLPVIEDDGNQFIEDLIDSMVTPIGDEGSAASVVPMVVRGPVLSGEKIRHITFERQHSDQWLVERAERALERILQGLDIPKEVVTGLANVKYSNALIIDENFYRTNIEPLCLALADSLTEVYLKPVLRSRGVTEAELARLVVWYDPSEIITRPTQSQDASDGYDKMLISGNAWRREHGFAETDAPTETELALMMLVKLGTMPEDTATALLNAILPTVLGKQREAAIAAQPVAFPDSAANILQINSGRKPAPAPAPAATGG